MGAFKKSRIEFDIRDLPVQPWQNGLGATREIAKGAMQGVSSAANSAWDWRISFADLTSDAAFSTFEGVDRVAILAGSSPAILKDASATMVFEQQGDMHAFPGEQLLHAALPGSLSTQLLNLMTRRGAAQATVEVNNTALTHRAVQAIGLLIVLRGTFSIDGCDTHGRQLPNVHIGPGRGMYWQEGLASVQATPSLQDACLVCIQIQPATSSLQP